MKNKLWRNAKQELEMMPCTQLLPLGLSRDTGTLLGNTWMERLKCIHRPRLGSRTTHTAPRGALHTHACTYSRSPFTTSTQWDSVREVAEADLGQNGERHARALAGRCVDSSHSSLHFARGPRAHSLLSPAG